MRVDKINPAFDISQSSESGKSNGFSFGQYLKDALDSVNETQVKADGEANKLITGETTDVHEALLSAEEARIQMELVMQIRNKLVDSYQEISRMQV